MSDFTRGLARGFAFGTMGAMFGFPMISRWGCCQRFNIFCGCNTPRFYTPMMNFNNFNRYYTPTVNVSFPAFNSCSARNIGFFA